MKVNRGPVTAGDSPESMQREGWRLLQGARRSFVHTEIPYLCRELLRFVEEATPEWLAHFGYSDIADYLRRGLEIDPALVEWARSGLQSLDPEIEL